MRENNTFRDSETHRNLLTRHAKTKKTRSSMVADTKLILVYMIIDNDSVKFWLLVTAEYWKKVKHSVSSPTCDYCTRLTVSA